MIENIEESMNEAKPEKTGAEIVIDVLNELGVDHIFGHTGGAVIPLHVELNARMARGELVPRFVLCRQESGAGHAAEGYARASGKVGVALATSGPGATNLVTPIADAYKDSVPCVFITGQVPSTMIGNDAFQEVDMVGITRSITKHNFLIKHVDDVGGILRQAFHLARTGRPGPVVVDICKDALMAKSANIREARAFKRYHPNVVMDETRAESLLRALLSASKPVVKAGGGVIAAEAAEALKRFVEKYNLPTTLTFMGLGAIPHDSPAFIGMPGMHGTVAANYALQNADFILTVGARFDDRVAVKGFADGKIIAHVDIDAAEIGKNVPTRFGLHANSRDFLEFASRSDLKGGDISPWLEEIHGWKAQYELRCGPTEGVAVKPGYFVETLSRATADKATVVTGVGQHQMWAAQFYRYRRPRQWISSGGLGTMGFGVPAAIGAHFAKADAPIVCIDGDGSFQMNIQELATIAANRIPVKIFVLNNGFLGMVRQWEDLFNDGQHYETCLARTDSCDPGCVEVKECRTPNPNLLNLGSVYPGIKTLRIAKTQDVGPGIEQVLQDDRPYVVDVWIERTEDVKPMIPPGGALSDIICD
jgi:acetolactate synthase-1/2/3 large subunit